MEWSAWKENHGYKCSYYGSEGTIFIGSRELFHESTFREVEADKIWIEVGVTKQGLKSQVNIHK